MFSRQEGTVVMGFAFLAALFVGLGVLWHSEPLNAEKALLDFPDFTANKTSLPVDINQASLPELMELPGVGPVLAERILRYRLVHGPFRSVEELLHVQGIGPHTLERLRPFVRI